MWRPCLTTSVAAMQSVSEDTPLWDEDDALDEAEVEAKAKTKAKPVKKAAKPAAKPAAKAVVPKVKKAVAKAAKSGAAAAKVTHSQSSAIHDFRIGCQVEVVTRRTGRT